MANVKPLQNLDHLNGGTSKRWIWQKGKNYSKSCDYFQKINYCIQDLNHEIESLSNPSMKEVVFVIVLVDWIREAVNALPNLLIDGITKEFTYGKHDELDRANNYLSAIRSFAVAHPLSTNRHPLYGFDGDKICVDIRSKTSIITQVFTRDDDWYHLDYDGLTTNAKAVPADFVLFIYSNQKNKMQFFEYIGADFSDLYHVAELQIDKLYALDRYLGKLKKRDWLK